MLRKFFDAQYSFPIKDDWSEQVKQDLIDLRIPENFKMIQSKSKDSFGRLVKKRGKEFAFQEFIQKKAAHTKLDNLYYRELSLQSYLRCQNITVTQAKILLKFRTRMARYGNNYRGTSSDTDLCELCQTHRDAQDEIYICEFNKKHVTLNGTYQDLFNSEVKLEIVKILEEVYKKRENKLS